MLNERSKWGPAYCHKERPRCLMLTKQLGSDEGGVMESTNLKWTHRALVELAASWLAGQGCSVVLSEMMSAAGEIPDAIGWRGRGSTVVECKTSRADFQADRSKPFRRESWRGMGDARYYLAPPGLLQVADLTPGWGLLEPRGERLKVVRKSSGFPRLGEFSYCPAMNGHVAEITLLLSAVRRIGAVCPPGVAVKCYTIDSGKRSASMGVAGSDTAGPARPPWLGFG